MILRTLSLSCFRSFEEADFEFCEGINVISGPNGVGKTNLLESVFYLSCVKSLRAAKDGDMIRFGSDSAVITAEVRSDGREHSLTACLQRGQKRKLLRDGLSSTPREWLGLLPSVLFCPSDVSLLRGGPAERLAFMNMALCQMKPRYTDTLSQYRSLFQGKQKLLQQAAAAPSFLNLMEDYNLRMAETGAVLHRYRSDFIRDLERLAGERHRAVSDHRERLRLRYRSHAGDPKETFVHMQERRDAELRLGRSLVGAHRDEIEVLLDDRPIRHFGSQGQVRSAVIALKLGLRDLQHNLLGEPPLLLLDDVLSELDSGRRQYILEALDGGQVLITGCEPGLVTKAGHNILMGLSIDS